MRQDICCSKMKKIYSLAILIFIISHVQAQANIYFNPDGSLNYYGQIFRYAGAAGYPTGIYSTYGTGTGGYQADAAGYPTGVQAARGYGGYGPAYGAGCTCSGGVCTNCAVG